MGMVQLQSAVDKKATACVPLPDSIAVDENRDTDALRARWSVLLSSDAIELSMQRTTAVTAACCDLT